MRKLITEQDVLTAWKRGDQSISITGDTLITPAARDAARSKQIAFVSAHTNLPQKQNPAKTPPAQTAAPSGHHVVIGADHGGFQLKSVLVEHLQKTGAHVKDLGTFSEAAVDYPDIALAVAEAVARGEARFGIILDGAGIGSAMVANKVPGIRAACCNDLFTATNSREHNGANVLTLGGRVIGPELAKKIVDVWLSTNFGGGRHQRRLDKIKAIEAKFHQPQ